MEIDAEYGDKGKNGKHAKGKKDKDKGKGKHKGKHENSPKFECYCGHCGKWRHKQKDCRYKNIVAEVDEEESVEPPNSSASSSTTRVTPPPPGLSLAGTAQSTTGSISTLMEAHAQSGWLCELVVGSDDARVREGEFVELLVDTGATEHVCGPHDFAHAAQKNGPRLALKTKTGEPSKHYGTRTVDFRCQGEELRVVTHLPYQPWCNVCVRARGSRSITNPARHTRYQVRPLLPEDRGRCSKGHSPGGHRHSV